MVKMVLGSVVKLDEEEKVKVSLKNPSSKPESRGVKGFFLS